jgi:osmotically inducible lipoprotein OsmB
MRKLDLVVLSGAMLALGACVTTPPERAVSGAAIGAGTGAAIGAIAGGPAGAAFGAWVGGASGALAGAITPPTMVDLGTPVWDR